MLLAVDIGNTSTKFGVFDGESLSSKFSIPTVPAATIDDLISVVGHNIDDAISEAIVCSVVAEADASIRDFLVRLGADHPVFVANDHNFGMEIDYEPLSAAGTDRLVNAFSAAEKYLAPCMVCSFGTATTIDIVDSRRVFRGGTIAPGMQTMSRALSLSTARLPEVEIDRPETVIGNSTLTSIRSGIFFGHLSMVEGMIHRIKKEIGSDPKVIATGGYAGMLADCTDQIDVLDEDLLLDGLRLLYSRMST